MAINQTSRLVNSLASFILDTKPFHSKLTTVVTEFQFNDDVSVRVAERLTSSLHQKGVWAYPWLSGGDASAAQLTAVQRLLRPAFAPAWKNDDPAHSRGAFKAFRDELTDLPLVPLAFDQRSLRGPGLTDAWLERGGATREGLTEGHDVYLSHGAHVFQVWQTRDGAGNPAPLYQVREAEGVIAAARQATIDAALNLANPASAVNVLTAEMTGLRAAIAAAAPGFPAGTYTTADDAAAAALVILAVPDLPPDYEVLLGALRALPAPALAALAPDYADPDALEDRLETATPTLYFGGFTDLGQRRGATLSYPPAVEDFVSAYLTADPEAAAYERWVLTAVDAATFAVTGSTSGYVGVAAVGATTAIPGGSLQLVAGPTPPVAGDEATLTPSSPVVIHPDAPLEAWSLVKVNPRAYSRPQVRAAGVTRVVDQGGQPGVTVLDLGFPATTLTLATADGVTFAVSSSADPLYAGTATVGVPFNDGRLAFTVLAGAACPPAPGDRLYVDLANEPPAAEGWGLSFGYDLDSFDADSLVYENQNPGDPDHLRTLDFGYDGRFPTYAAASFGLAVDGAAVDGRTWRLRALADPARPIDVMRKDGTVGNEVDFTATDPSILLPSYDMPTDVTSEGQRSAYDPDLLPDLALWYADRFALEWYDAGASAWVQEAVVPVGASYSGNGLSFTAAAGDKPFIAAKLTSSWYPSNSAPTFLSETTDGGDVFSWTVDNPAPAVTSVELASASAPRLVMHGDSFQATPAGTWTLAFTSPTTAVLTGVAAGGGVISPTPTNVDLSAGRSFRDRENDVHFTVLPGACGFAAGDTVTFETYARKPSYLVHGSVSGWQPDAVVGEWYWNGKIGFELALPEVTASEAGTPLTNQTTARAASTAEVFDLDGPQTVGGAALVAGDRALLVSQADPTENGLWVVAAGPWARAPEADSAADLRLLVVDVAEGDHAGTRWAQTATVTTVGVDPCVFVEFTGDWYSSYGPLSATLRPDAETAMYAIRATGVADRWMLYRAGALVGAGAGTVTDGLVTVTLPPGAVAGAHLELRVEADGHELAFAHDQAIVRTSAARAPTAADFVAFGRAGRDELQVAVKAQGTAHAAALAALLPASVDPRFVDTFAAGGVPLAFTSPETAVFSGWLPMLAADRDGPSSEAVFRDGAIATDLTSAATGEAIGTVGPATADPASPVVLRWAPSFVSAYLPVNAEVTAVTYGSGMVEDVRVRATENLGLLVDGGPFPASALFRELTAVAAADESFMRITMSPDTPAAVLADDGPFAGFLQGYDTLRFDFETEHGDLEGPLGGAFSTDEGLPAAVAEALDAAYALAGPPIPADAEGQEQLVQLFAAVANYLVSSPTVDAAVAAVVDYLEGGGTTLADAAQAAADLLLSAPLAGWQAAVAGSPYLPPPTADAFGVPARGLGIQVSAESGDAAAGAATEEAYVMGWADSGAPYALYGYGAGALDAYEAASAVLSVDAVPPLPASGLPAPATAWADFETPLLSPPALRVEVRLGGPLGPTPAVWVWAEDEDEPVQASEVERLTASSIAVTWPRAVRLKLILA